MKKLARFKPLWIEEPTSPDDVNAHAKISKVIVFQVIDMKTLSFHINLLTYKIHKNQQN